MWKGRGPSLVVAPWRIESMVPEEIGHGPPMFRAAPQEQTLGLMGSDLESHGNDCFGDSPQAGVVVSGVPAHELVGLIN